MEPLVTIAMPVYNTEKYLVECIESILSQTYSKWELIAVNDYSTDNSKEILTSYANRDSRIHTYDNTFEKGITPSLLLAESKSTGQYITRMDADDKMHPSKIEALLQVAQKNENTLAIGLVKYFSEEKEIGEGYRSYENWINELAINKSSFEEIYKECVIPSPSWMLNKKTFNKIGGFNALAYPEDYDLTFRMYKSNLKVEATNEVVHFWRDHFARSSRNDPNYLDNRFIELKVNYFLEINKNDKPLLLWGTGKKGKSIAKRLITSNIDFTWCTNNQNKIGHNVYDKIIESIPLNLNEFQIIIAVANKMQQLTILNTLEQHQNSNYFYFC